MPYPPEHDTPGHRAGREEQDRAGGGLLPFLRAGPYEPAASREEVLAVACPACRTVVRYAGDTRLTSGNLRHYAPDELYKGISAICRDLASGGIETALVTGPDGKVIFDSTAFPGLAPAPPARGPAPMADALGEVDKAQDGRLRSPERARAELHALRKLAGKVHDFLRTPAGQLGEDGLNDLIIAAGETWARAHQEDAGAYLDEHQVKILDWASRIADEQAS
jgi:hypothetical protein